MFAMLQMHGICMDTSLTEPEILSAQNSATVAQPDARIQNMSASQICTVTGQCGHHRA